MSGDFLGRTRRVTFGPFTFDPETRQLLRGSGLEPVHLSPKAYELLCVLVDTRPRAVAKSELHQQLWPSTFVSEATLASLVGELREALGEHGRDARFIRTVHGFGYAFSGKTDVAGTLVESTRHWIICNGRETPLAEGEYLIGRDPDMAIALSSPSVSRQHAKLIVTNDLTTVEDLGSKNGTYLQGRAVTSPAALADGDRIRVGAFELTFRTVNPTLGRSPKQDQRPAFRSAARGAASPEARIVITIAPGEDYSELPLW